MKRASARLLESVLASILVSILALALLLLAGPLSAEDWTELDAGIRASETVLVGGQPSEELLREAADAGYEVVVDFRSEAEDPGYDEAAVAAEQGLAYFRVPVAGASGLTKENVLLFDAVQRQVGDRPALMHCASGNRVGAIHALHGARFKDMSPEEAVAYGRQYGLTDLEGAVRERLEE